MATPRKKYARSAPQGGIAGWGLTSLSSGRRLLLLGCIFVLMMVLASFSTGIAAQVASSGSRQYLLAVNALQCVIGFAGTALLTALFVSTRPLALLAMNRGLSSRAVLGVILVMALGVPFLNYVTHINEQITLGGGEIYRTLRSWEDLAAATTGSMLDTRSTGGLIAGVLVVGVLTGLCEELLFRGALQRILSASGMGAHAAVWTAAVIFSLLHFQFFGFLPRVLLGAFFGYLLLWTGSVYVSATAHAINNSVYVLLHWLALRGADTTAIEQAGVTSAGFPAMAMLSLVLVLVLLVGMRKQFFT